jgi:hypothetical protein
MTLNTTGIPDFLKIYVPLLACGVLVSSIGTGAEWTYLLWRPGTTLGLIFQSALTFAISSFVIGSCAWAFLSLTVFEEVGYLSSVLWTLVALVVATGLGAV